MRCPNCTSKNTRIVCSEYKGNTKKRYCRCLDCEYRYQTLETVISCYQKQVTALRGNKHPSSILTEDNVRDIRQRASTGASTASIARVYGMDPNHIRRIIRGISWKHVV